MTAIRVRSSWAAKELLQTPLALALATAVFAVLALAMFGAFEIALPAALAGRPARVGRGSDSLRHLHRRLRPDRSGDRLAARQLHGFAYIHL